MSDMANTAAAFNFLREIEERKQNELDLEEQNEIVNVEFKKRKITYNKSTGLKSKIQADEDSVDAQPTTIQGSKLIMPEYVIGQKPIKGKKKSIDKNKKISSTSMQLRLDHLLEEDEIE